MIRRPPRSTLDRSPAASDVYKRQAALRTARGLAARPAFHARAGRAVAAGGPASGSYTHLRAHETVLDLVCRLLLETKKRITRRFCTFIYRTYTPTQPAFN